MVRTEAPADWRKPPETANPLHLQLLHQGSTLLRETLILRAFQNLPILDQVITLLRFPILFEYALLGMGFMHGYYTNT
jgi:hypothetical protein